MVAIHALNVMKEGHDGSGLGLFLRDLGGAFERFRGAPILSGIFSNEGIRTLDHYMMDLDFMVKYKLSIRPAKTPPPGTPKRDNYLVRVYDYPPDWQSLSQEEIEHRLMLTRLKLRQMGEADGSMMVFSFWPDVIVFKEVGDPMAVAGYLGLNSHEELHARIIMAQGRQNTNYSIDIYACHPFFIQGFATMTNGENTAFGPIREFLSSRNYPGYVGYQSDSEVFTHILHYARKRLGLDLNMYKHIITPLKEEELKRHPNGDALRLLKHSCRPMIIDGPNCVIGSLPDHSLFMAQDSKKLRPGVVGGSPGMYAFSSEMCGLDVAIPSRHKRDDFQPMKYDTVVIPPQPPGDDQMEPMGCIGPSTLSKSDLPWQITWSKEKCTLCGRCTAVCPVRAIELGVHRKRIIQVGIGLTEKPGNLYGVYHGIRQKTDPAFACIGCGMCDLVCPNGAIAPVRNEDVDKLRFHVNQGGLPRRRGGRRNDPRSVLDEIKFVRISMLTDPALDAGRHEFELRTLLGRILPAEEMIKASQEHGWVPPVREIYPLIVGGMSFGALSPTMWEGLQMGVAYLNEELNMPVRISTGEGGCPPRLLHSRFLKYVILQIASGYFGWDEIIHALPDMKEDPCAIEIKYGQGAKPGDGGLLMWYKVNKLIAAIRGVPPGVSLPSPPTHQTQYSIEESVAKMIQSMSMAWGFRVPVYPKISATSTSLAVLNNLTRNPYAGALAIDGEDGGTGAAYNVSMNHMGHPIASNIRDAYLNLVKIGKQNELPLIAGGGIGKNGNLAANAAALIMLGASGIQIGKYIMQAAAGCLGSEVDRCNICNIGLCPKGITSQDARLYQRLDPEMVAERVVDVFLSFDQELKKIVAPLGRSTSLPIGMSDALGITNRNAAERLQIRHVL